MIKKKREKYKIIKRHYFYKDAEYVLKQYLYWGMYKTVHHSPRRETIEKLKQLLEHHNL